MALIAVVFLAAPLIGLLLRTADWLSARRRGRPFRFWSWR